MKKIINEQQLSKIVENATRKSIEMILKENSQDEGILDIFANRARKLDDKVNILGYKDTDKFERLYKRSSNNARKSIGANRSMIGNFSPVEVDKIRTVNIHCISFASASGIHVTISDGGVVYGLNNGKVYSWDEFRKDFDIPKEFKVNDYKIAKSIANWCKRYIIIKQSEFEKVYPLMTELKMFLSDVDTWLLK